MSGPRISPLGDSAITVTLGEGISEELSERVVGQADAISAARIGGVTDVVPSYAALAVYYDPLTIEYADLHREILAAVEAIAVPPGESASRRRAERLHRIAVRYDGEDLEEVARLAKLSVEDVIRIHTASEYRVFVIGFVPGFAYLGPLDSRLALPRRESPRKRVPAGSVAIAERQTGIYPSETPGGWHLIGSTDQRMFDPERDPPALLEAGDRVRFEVVT